MTFQLLFFDWLFMIILFGHASLSSGFYMYTESSSPRSRGQKARLISPKAAATQGKCLTFYYHMNGNNMGTLSIYKMRNNRLYTPVWTVGGSQGDIWQPAQVTMTSSTDFQVRRSFSLPVSLSPFNPLPRKRPGANFMTDTYAGAKTLLCNL